MSHITQGPEWLGELIYHPPEWLATTLGVGLLVLAVVVVGALFYRARDGVDEADAEAFGGAIANGLLVLSIALATLTLRETASLPYLWDVVGGVLGGGLPAYAINEGVQWPRVVREAASREAGDSSGDASTSE